MLSISVAAEPIFYLGNFTVTNSMINAWIAIGVFLIIGLIVRSRVKLAPRGFLNLVDYTIEFMLVEVEKIMGDKKLTRKVFPICGALFFFVLLSNWMGLLPGIGSIGVNEVHHGENVLVPLFRPVTADLNFTLAIAVFAIITTHVFGLFTLGVVAHVSKFFNFRGIYRAIKKGPMDLIVALVEFFVGILEIIGEIAKTLSLALRLFGNIFAGEVLLTVIYSLVSYVVPLPFIFLELLVGIIQATVFAMLTLVFIKSMTDSHDHEEAH